MARPPALHAALAAVVGVDTMRCVWPWEGLKRAGIVPWPGKPGHGARHLDMHDAAALLIAVMGNDHGPRLVPDVRAFCLLENTFTAEPRPDDTVVNRLNASATFIEAVTEVLASSVEVLAMLAAYASAAHPGMSREAAARLLWPPHQIAGCDIEVVRMAGHPVGAQIKIWKRNERREPTNQFVWTFTHAIPAAEAVMRATQGTDCSDKRMIGLRGLLRIAGCIADRADDEAEAATTESKST